MTVACKMVLADCQRCTLVPLLNNGAKAAPASAQALMLAVVRPSAIGNRVFDIWNEWSYPQLLLHWDYHTRG